MKDKKDIKIYFDNAVFEKEKLILRERYNIIKNSEPDYIIVNAFYINNPKLISKILKTPIRILTSTEALVPDFNIFDYAITYDKINFGDRHLQLDPYKFLILYRSLEKYFPLLTKEKEVQTSIINKKKFFCNFIYSNPKAHYYRDEFFHKLNHYKKVDSAGTHLNNMGKSYLRNSYSDDWFGNGIKFKTNYKFSVAFENALHENYTTEKIFSSFFANTIPIYWGNPNIGEYFNTKSFINCHEYENFNEVIEKIIELDQDEEKYLEMLNEPWLTEQQKVKCEISEKEIKEFLYNIFDQEITNSRRRGYGTYNNTYEDGFKRLSTTPLSSKLKDLKKFFK